MRSRHSLPVLSLLAALLAPAAAPRAEDGFSPITGRDLGDPACGPGGDDPLGTPPDILPVEGGEDGASPAGPATLEAACLAAGQGGLLPENWQAWRGWRKVPLGVLVEGR